MKISVRLSCCVFSAAILSGALSACEEEEDEEEGDTELTAGFFLTSDLEAGSALSTLSSTAAVASLQSSDAVYDEEPSGSSLLQDDDPVEACLTGIVDKFSFRVDGDTMTYGLDADINSCMDLQSAELENITFSNGRLRMFIRLKCADGDLSSFAGATFTESEELELSCGNTEETFQFETTGTVAFSDGTNTSSLDFRSLNYYGTAAGGDCTSTAGTDERTWSDECTEIDRYVQSNQVANDVAQDDEEEFSRFDASALVSNTPSTTYYKSGALSVTLNQWTGTITYSNGTTAPTFEITDGSSSESGTYGSSTSSTSSSGIKTLHRQGKRLRLRFRR